MTDWRSYILEVELRSGNAAPPEEVLQAIQDYFVEDFKAQTVQQAYGLYVDDLLPEHAHYPAALACIGPLRRIMGQLHVDHSLAMLMGKTLGVESELSGVIVLEMVRGSPAAHISLRPGDVIRAINGRDIKTLDDIEGVIATGPQRWRLHAGRNGPRPSCLRSPFHAPA